MANRYNPHGIHPIDIVQNIQHDVPLLLVASKKDLVVPFQDTKSLHDKLKQASHPAAHLLILNEGGHNSLIWESDKRQYRNDTHAFLRHYELPHNKDCAQASTNSDFVSWRTRTFNILKDACINAKKALQRPNTKKIALISERHYIHHSLPQNPILAKCQPLELERAFDKKLT